MAATAHELIAGMTRREAREALLNARATLERAMRELDGYLDQFEAAEDNRQRARVMNWTLNYLATNILTNLRIDRLADAQAELTRLAD